MPVLINTMEWYRIKAKIEGLTAELSELREAHDSTINDILNMAPQCWEDDVYAGAIAVDFVKSLVEGTTEIPGHRNDCTCEEGLDHGML